MGVTNSVTRKEWPMHAVVVREASEAGAIDGSGAVLEANVVPRVRDAPGIVSALWMSDGSGGTLNVLVFESEDAARAALEPARNAPRPPFMRLEQAGVYRVLASL
jgi:hypothetical protein